MPIHIRLQALRVQKEPGNRHRLAHCPMHAEDRRIHANRPKIRVQGAQPDSTFGFSR